jgi:hypothetical protein
VASFRVLFYTFRFFILASNCKFGALYCPLSVRLLAEALRNSISAFFAAASLSGAFSGLLAAAIVKMDGLAGKPGWAWIFILVSFFCV